VEAMVLCHRIKPQLACRMSLVYGFRSCLRGHHEGIAVRYGLTQPRASYNPPRMALHKGLWLRTEVVGWSRGGGG
jgi:hypothetical protein